MKNVFKKGKTDEFKSVLDKPPHGTIHMRTKAIPIIKDKKAIQAILVNTDITKEKNDEEEIQNKTMELQESNEQISKLLETRTEFINKIAHDLGTPLTPIIGLLPEIKKKVDSPEISDLMDIVITSAEKISNIVDEFNNGVDFADFSGHGNYAGWSTHPHGQEDVRIPKNFPYDGFAYTDVYLWLKNQKKDEGQG